MNFVCVLNCCISFWCFAVVTFVVVVIFSMASLFPPIQSDLGQFLCTLNDCAHRNAFSCALRWNRDFLLTSVNELLLWNEANNKNATTTTINKRKATDPDGANSWMWERMDWTEISTGHLISQTLSQWLFYNNAHLKCEQLLSVHWINESNW